MKTQILLACLILTFTMPLVSQNVSDVTFINEIANKDTAQIADAAKLFKVISGKTVPSGKSREPLRRGKLALMIARYLNLNDVILYNLFGTERYAFRACVADGLMEYRGSEWDILNGGELVEIMRKVADRVGGEK